MRPGTAPPRRAAVIGGGIVGICCARCLQGAGFQVELVDRDRPGAGASAGNLGMICSLEPATLPLPSMRLLRALPGMLARRNDTLALRWRRLPGLLPWLLRFARAAPARQRWRGAQAMATLMRETVPAWQALVAGSPAQSLIRHNGALALYESEAAFAADAAERDLLRRLGADFVEIDAAAIATLEPALAPIFRRGVHFRGSAQTTSPFGLAQALADDFRRAGGSVRRAHVAALAFDGDGRAAAVTAEGRIEAEALVIACGARSGPLAAAAGFGVPLEAERGYHMQAAGIDSGLERPVFHGENHIGVTQMREGLRIGGTVEFAGPDAPPTPGRARRIFDLGRRMLADPDIAEGARQQPWMGSRPTLPDYLPAIGPSPHHRGLFFAFGHQHVGLSLAAVTGRIVARLAQRRDAGIDLAPFRIDRFRR